MKKNGTLSRLLSHCGLWICLSTLAFGQASASDEISHDSYAYNTFIPLPKLGSIHFHSQAAQDEFVYTLLYGLLGKQDAGYYLEIGGGHPWEINNSCFFERTLGWKGVSIDISKQFKKLWRSSRKNPLLIEDATQSDYLSILESFPKTIDYLSLDIDGQYNIVLEKIPFDEYTFKIITIEHDSYRFGDVYKEKERSILTALGYYLLCPDVIYPEVGLFEDWWIHPSVFPPSVFAAITSLDLKEKNYSQVIQIIQENMFIQKL